MGQHINNYSNGWTNEAARPDACLLDFSYNFKDMYVSIIQKIKGFTRTQTDPGYARAFRISRNKNNNNMVELFYKAKPEDPNWLGVEKRTDIGFSILPRNPGPGPKLLEPRKVITKQKLLAEMKNPKYQKVVDEAGLGKDALPWCYNVAKTGTVPTDPVPLAELEKQGLSPDDGLGEVRKIGIRGKQGTIRVIKSLKPNEFWSLTTSINELQECWKNLVSGDPEVNVSYLSKAVEKKVRS